MDFSDSTAIVTGGGQGIGLGIAGRLVDRGAAVVLFDVAGDRAHAAARELASRGRAIAYAGDVTRADDVEGAFAAAERAFGRPRILVNNAGNARATLIADCDEEQWETTLGIHLKGTFLCTRAFARRAREDGEGGAVLNLSSVNGTHATEGAADYCAAKAGIEQFTKVAALELAPYGVRVNAVAPGGTQTPMAERHARMREEFVARTPLGRFGRVEDIAKAAVFLLSDEGGWITGVTLAVDGGLHLRGVHNFHAVLGEETGP